MKWIQLVLGKSASLNRLFFLKIIHRETYNSLRFNFVREKDQFNRFFHWTLNAKSYVEMMQDHVSLFCIHYTHRF